MHITVSTPISCHSSTTDARTFFHFWTLIASVFVGFVGGYVGGFVECPDMGPWRGELIKRHNLQPKVQKDLSRIIVLIYGFATLSTAGFRDGNRVVVVGHFFRCKRVPRSNQVSGFFSVRTSLDV